MSKKRYSFDNVGHCLPIGGQSIWSTFSSDMSFADSKPIILVNSKFDGNALIRDSAYGASMKSGVAAVLGIMDALSAFQVQIQSFSKSIVFTSFDAESWSFSGSEKFVEDLVSPFTCRNSNDGGGCPIKGAACSEPCKSTLDYKNINFDMIESIIDFDTVGNPLTNRTLFLHVDNQDLNTGNLTSQFEVLGDPISTNGSTAYINLLPASENRRLPPTPAMAFLKRKKIPTIVISDYLNEFSNKFLETEFDNGDSWNATSIEVICGLATLTAKRLYSLASGISLPLVPTSLKANCTLVISA